VALALVSLVLVGLALVAAANPCPNLQQSWEHCYLARSQPRSSGNVH